MSERYMPKLKKGYIHIYTGDGKGKTTASLGLAVRAVSAGLKVSIIQFLKRGTYSELKVQSKLNNLRIEQFGSGCFITKKPTRNDIFLAHKALRRVEEVFESKKFDLVILDELTIALFYKLVTKEEVLKILSSKPKKTELIITGRKAPTWLVDKADLVTEMKKIKHYYDNGVKARRGIEC